MPKSRNPKEKDLIETVEQSQVEQSQRDALTVDKGSTDIQSPVHKKPYIAPKLSHEGKWDTVTMQFGGSFVAP